MCPDHPPPAGQQLALAAWLLRFYEPRHDGGRLSQLCRLILAGLEEGAEAERAFCVAALSRPLTRHWVAVLHRLLLACAKQLTPVGGALPDVADSGSALVYLSDGDPTGLVGDQRFHTYVVSTNGTELVDVTPQGTPGEGHLIASVDRRPRISAAGAYVAFHSDPCRISVCALSPQPPVLAQTLAFA